MSQTQIRNNESPQILIVPKEVGGIWLPILCFLIGMLNFGLLANVVVSLKKPQLIDAPETESEQELASERSHTYRTRYIRQKRYKNW